LLIAGQYDGIYSARTADVIARGGGSLQQVYAGQTFGLDWLSTGELYVGGNDFDQPYCTLCTSNDSGHSLRPAMNLCEVSFPDQCGADSTVARLCKTHGDMPGVWDAPQKGFEAAFLQGPLCVGPNSIPMLETDGGATAGRGGPEGGAPNSSTAESGTAESGAPIDGGVGAKPPHSTRFVAGCGCELPSRGGAPGYTAALSLVGLLVGASRRRRQRARSVRGVLFAGRVS
jgi:MYXO-CTERM domain-containing protein